ncbi:unnamed protein product, partial [Ectocarpus sp. 13 AM-2016]
YRSSFYSLLGESSPPMCVPTFPTVPTYCFPSFQSHAHKELCVVATSFRLSLYHNPHLPRNPKLIRKTVVTAAWHAGIDSRSKWNTHVLRGALLNGTDGWLRTSAIPLAETSMEA